MERREVQSSNIKAIGYDEERMMLEIEFLSGGVYQYDGVQPETVSELVEAKSIGSYFHYQIRDQYDYRKIS